MTDQPSTSSGKRVDNVSEIYPETPTDPLFAPIRQHANQTTPSSNVQHTPNASPERPRLFLGMKISKRKRVHDGAIQHSKKRRVQSQDPQTRDTQIHPAQTLDQPQQHLHSLQESMDEVPESLHDIVDVDTETVNIAPSHHQQRYSLHYCLELVPLEEVQCYTSFCRHYLSRILR